MRVSFKYALLFLAAFLLTTCRATPEKTFSEVDIINQIRLKVYELEKIGQIHTLEKELSALIDDIRFDQIQSDETFTYIKQYVDQNLAQQVNQKYFELYDQRIKQLKERSVTSAANYQNQRFVAYTAASENYSSRPLTKQATVALVTSARAFVSPTDGFALSKQSAWRSVKVGASNLATTRRLAGANPSLMIAMATMNTSTAAVETFQDAHRLVLLEDQRFEAEIEIVRSEYDQKRNSIITWMDSAYTESRSNEVDAHLVRNSDLSEFYSYLEHADPEIRLEALAFARDSILTLPQFHLAKARAEIEAGQVSDAARTLDAFFEEYVPITFSHRFERESIRLRAGIETDPKKKKALIETLLMTQGSSSSDRILASQMYLELGETSTAIDLARTLYSMGDYQDAAAVILATNSASSNDLSLLRDTRPTNNYYELLSELHNQTDINRAGFLTKVASVDHQNLVVRNSIRIKLDSGWYNYLDNEDIKVVALNKDESLAIDCTVRKDRSGNYEILVPVDIFGENKLDTTDDFQIILSGLPTTLNFKVQYTITEMQGEGALFKVKERLKLNSEKNFLIDEICSIGRCLIRT